MSGIGGKLYRLDKRPLKERQSVQWLTKEQLDDLVNEGWADIPMVAYILQLRDTTIRGWIKAGKIKAAKGPGGRWFIPLNQFSKLLDVPTQEVLWNRHHKSKFLRDKNKKYPRALRFMRSQHAVKAALGDQHGTYSPDQES